MTTFSHAPLRGVFTIAALCVGVSGAVAQSPAFGHPGRFTYKDGEAIFQNVCQACHMPNGVGAVGAGKFPALAKNEKLAAGGYPVFILLNGLKGMPSFSRMLDDDQIAAVTNYVRTHFGNNYTDAVTAADVKGSR